MRILRSNLVLAVKDNLLEVPSDSAKLNLQDCLVLLQPIEDLFEALLLLPVLLCLLLQPLGELGDLGLKLFGLLALLKEDGEAGFNLRLALDRLQGKKIKSVKAVQKQKTKQKS